METPGSKKEEWSPPLNLKLYTKYLHKEIRYCSSLTSFDSTHLRAITMTSTILNKAGKKLFEAHMEKYAPADPLYEYYIDDRGKKRKRRVRYILLFLFVIS